VKGCWKTAIAERDQHHQPGPAVQHQRERPARDGYFLAAALSIRAADSKSLAVRVVVDPQYAGPGSHPILFRVQSVGKPALVVEKNPALSGSEGGDVNRPAPAG
jgi:hypothetical protein